ncbi:MAG: hypothetical protein AB8H80_07090 [Planctomycetota bacterium]
MKGRRLVLAMVFLAALLPAQEAANAERAAMEKQVVKSLLQFARQAKGQRLPSRAREVFQMILDHYDEDLVAARKGLGFRNVAGEWERSKRYKKAEDAADAQRRGRVGKAWQRTCVKVGGLHRDYGKQLQEAGDISQALYQFERALTFLPEDRDCHLGLGHVAIDGFFGTEVQVATVARLREIRSYAAEVIGRDFDVEMLDSGLMPKSLQKTGLTFYGARSKHFTHWHGVSAEVAAESLQWAERAHELANFLLGSHATKMRSRDPRYLAVVKDHADRDVLLVKAPEACGDYTIDQAKLFGGSQFKDDGRRWAEYAVYREIGHDDQIVGHVFKRHVSVRNMAFSEGLVHAATWLLCGTTQSTYSTLPKTVTKGFKPLGSDPERWRMLLWDAIDGEGSYPLVHLPRERADNFRQEARLKTWSFVVFLLARYPNDWAILMSEMGGSKDLTVELVGERIQKVLDRSVGELEAEWREWARRGSRWGRVSGW